MPNLRAIIFLISITVSALYSQGSSNAGNTYLQKYFQFDNPHPLACLFTYFPSIFIQHEMELKSFIRSKTFKHLREEYGDVKSVDAIYIRAMQLTNNNTAISLLLATLATLDHRIMQFKIPIVQFALPLTDESWEEYLRRINNLPRTIYDDSPESGDRDKLQHFFGSAFLTFISESRYTADSFGIFVEKGEGIFIAGGTNDERDLRADRQGQNFGSALLINNLQRPSKFFTNIPNSLKTNSAFPQKPWREDESSNISTSRYSCEGP